MANIKAHLVQLQNNLKVAKNEGQPKPDIGHFIFKGSPGTGKTTVARAMSRILYEMEMLASPKIVETSGSDLTGEYVGQTKTKVSEKLGQARGAVLFIDEAYELGKGSYGEEAMTTLLAAMTDPEYRGIVIIIAGYEHEIDEMLDRNPGLKSRFSNSFYFNDWSATDTRNFLMQELKSKYEIRDEDQRQIELIILQRIQRLQALPGWANARDALAIGKKFQIIRSERVVQFPESIPTIQLAEIDRALEEMIRERTPAKGEAAIRGGRNQSSAYPRQLSAPPPQQQFASSHEEREVTRPQSPISGEDLTHDTEELSAENGGNHDEENADEDDDDLLNADFSYLLGGTRDSGVSDEVWEELEAIKRRYFEELERLRREREIEKLRLELEKQKATQERIRRLCSCPMGFAWYQVGGGWRCAGGSHYVSNEQLQANFMQ
ncbi:P-loop containing nucleoside triphosphate hydrolase protein [Polychytrium aggregatum]|uniref:P-loop containing nucleoside triphosphate hydrolase protein n=1 Tax=Polychytrium aggregatum TaxID=110093 RepID=UPI0022FEC412|nr:P-loop containing nucleoside triphosphate hydrolase protein [Polychytrium aggregatum]KAI9205170.1 P-loop containing nucleoside triphosphate hydrolase protein [Polychytrium aggregatum]